MPPTAGQGGTILSSFLSFEVAGLLSALKHVIVIAAYGMPWPALTASCKFNYAAKEKGGEGDVMIWAITGNNHLEATLKGKDATVSK